MSTRSFALEPLLALPVCGLLFLAAPTLASALNSARPNPGDLDERVYVPDPSAARFLAAGYNEVAADLVWARTVVYYGGAITERKSGQDLDGLIELVNALDPKFRRPYDWGGYALGVTGGSWKPAEGRKGFVEEGIPQSSYWKAVRVFTRGTQNLPDDAELLKAVGDQYYFYIAFPGDKNLTSAIKELGVRYFERAMRAPGADASLSNLVATLLSKEGKAEAAMRHIQEMAQTVEDPAVREQLLLKYRNMAGAQMAEALESARQHFELEWKASLPFAPPTLFAIIGPAAPQLTLEALTERDDLTMLLNQGEDDPVTPVEGSQP